MTEIQQVPMVRTSERKDFKRCPQRWWWRWREGLRENGPPSPALWFGTGWHLVMAHWYRPGVKRGKEPLKVWRDFVKDEQVKVRVSAAGYENADEDEYIDAGQLGEAMIGAYIDRYGDEPWLRMVMPEKPFQVMIPDPRGNPLAYFCGTYDGIFIDERDGAVWVFEHKTAKMISIGHLPLDDQAGGYLMVAERDLRAEGLINDDQYVKGIMYNFVRKAEPDARPRNEMGWATNKPRKEHFESALPLAGVEVPAKATLKVLQELASQNNVEVLGDVSANQPSDNFLRQPVIRTPRERNGMLRRLRAELYHMESMRSRSLPVYKSPTRDCSWDCPFYNMCIMHESGGDGWKDLRDNAFHKEDPYADHREAIKEIGG